MEHNGGLQKLIKVSKIIGMIVGIITILTAFYYVTFDRFNVIAQIKENTKQIQENTQNIRQIEKIFSDKNTFEKPLNDIQYNLRRLLEKNGMKWENFDNYK